MSTDRLVVLHPHACPDGSWRIFTKLSVEIMRLDGLRLVSDTGTMLKGWGIFCGGALHYHQMLAIKSGRMRRAGRVVGVVKLCRVLVGKAEVKQTT